MRKKSAICLLLSLLLLTLPLETMAAEPGFAAFTPKESYQTGLFRDVPQDWYTENVATVYELGLMKGKGSGIFDPHANITLAETITVAAIIHATYHSGSADFPAADGAWYMPYLLYADEHGIASYFQEDQIWESHDNGMWHTTITDHANRAQFASILAKALPEEALPAINTLPDNTLPDINTYDFCGAEVYQLYRAGIITGSDDYGTFHPGSLITRKEVAAILARMVDPAQRREVQFKNPDYTVTGTCGDNYNWLLEDGIFWAEGGDNVTYSLDLGTGHMVIEGNGNIGIFQAWSRYTSRIKTVEIKPGVTGIGFEAFYNCVNLTEIIIPDSVTYIGSDAFEGCTSLTTFTMSDYVDDLGENVFSGCTALTYVRLSPQIKVLGRTVFSNCVSLTQVENTSQIMSYSIYCFNNCTSLKSLDINPSAKVDKSAFRECPAGAGYGA